MIGGGEDGWYFVGTTNSFLLLSFIIYIGLSKWDSVSWPYHWIQHRHIHRSIDAYNRLENVSLC